MPDIGRKAPIRAYSPFNWRPR